MVSEGHTSNWTCSGITTGNRVRFFDVDHSFSSHVNMKCSGMARFVLLCHLLYVSMIGDRICTFRFHAMQDIIQWCDFVYNVNQKNNTADSRWVYLTALQNNLFHDCCSEGCSNQQLRWDALSRRTLRFCSSKWFHHMLNLHLYWVLSWKNECDVATGTYWLITADFICSTILYHVFSLPMCTTRPKVKSKLGHALKKILQQIHCGLWF